MSVSDYRLIADIGGTNARFALLEEGSQTPISPRNLVCSEYPSLVEAVNSYLDSVSSPKPKSAGIAVATGVTNDYLKMTNNSWEFSIDESRKKLDLDRLKVINDFTALALAVPHLSKEKRFKIGNGAAIPQNVKAVIGPGTGLGVSGAIPLNGSWYPLQSEGGHNSYGPLNDREVEIIKVIRNSMDHVSAESLVSGAGLSLIYKSLLEVDGLNVEVLEPHLISEKVLNGNCSVAIEALSIFCEILGSVAGNLALTLGARGGVYIGGGIIPKVLDFFIDSNFRKRFEQRGRFTQYLSAIPTYVITSRYPALHGAAYSLEPEYNEIGLSSFR